MSLSEDDERVLREFEREFSGERLGEMQRRPAPSPAVWISLLVLGPLAFAGGLVIGHAGVALAVAGYVLIVAGVASAIAWCRSRPTASELAQRLLGRQARTWQKRSRS